MMGVGSEALKALPGDSHLVHQGAGNETQGSKSLPQRLSTSTNLINALK